MGSINNWEPPNASRKWSKKWAKSLLFGKQRCICTLTFTIWEHEEPATPTVPTVPTGGLKSRSMERS
eukprot:366447-Chlamydomonas_euryale.AAC.3